MSKLSGKISLITGGAQGLGKAFSEALLKRGAKVCIADVNAERGETTVKDFRQEYGDDSAVFVKCDVTSQEDMENAFKLTKSTFGGLDIVCNNAGIAHEGKWELVIQTNLTGVVRGTMLGIEYLRKDKGGNGGVIVNVASIAGLIPVRNTPVYCAAKHGVVGFTRSWADSRDCGRMDIKFHALCPAFVQTEILKPQEGQVLDRESLEKLGQVFGIMSIDHVADAFMQLVEKEGTTGEVLAVTLQKGLEWVPAPLTSEMYIGTV